MASDLIAKLRAALLRLNLAPSRRPPFVVRRYPYRDEAATKAALGPVLGATTEWRAEDGPLPDGDLSRLFQETANIHKWVHYLPVYERILAPFRERPIRMLEIGVFRGGSLDLWRRYLHPESTIVGIDIDPACKRFENAAKHVHVRIGPQQAGAFLASVAAEFGPFDVIIDDGSHMTSHMVESFRHLFPSALADGGVYVVEDVHSNYWSSHRDSPMSFVDFTGWLIDAMHAHYPQGGSEPAFRVGDATRAASVEVPLATVLIESIDVHDSIVVVRRARGRRELPRSVMR